jgi:hypothetical protein
MPSYRIVDKKTGTVLSVHVLGQGVQRSADQIRAQALKAGQKAIDVELIAEDELGKLPPSSMTDAASGGGGGATAGMQAKPPRRAPEVRFERR